MVRLFLPLFYLFAQVGSNASAVTLNMRVAETPVNLDWNNTSTITEAPFILNLCEGLYTYQFPSQKLIPGIADGVSKSKDFTTYTFKIRKDAKWSDGKAIVAQDFVDAWIRLLSPQSTSIYTYYLFDLLNAKEFNSGKTTSAFDVGVKASDEHTLTVKLKRPIQNWEINTAFWPLFPIRKDQIEKFGSNWWRAGVMISSGPFIFDSYEAGKKAVLKRNPEYKRHQSNVDEIDIYIISDHEEVLKRYDQQFFDFVWGIPFSLLKQFQNRADYQVQNIQRMHLLGLNTEKFPMSNREFRKAVLLSVDPKNLIPKNANQLHLSKTLIPHPLPGSDRPTLLTYDPKAAKEHLLKSGIVIDKKMKLRILTSIAEPFLSVGKLLQNQLSQNLGIEVEIAAPQSQEYTAYMNLGDYNATLITWTAKVLSPQDFLLPYSGEAAYNRMKFKNSFFDQWISDGIISKNLKEANDAFYQAQKVIAVDEAVVTPLFYEVSSNLIRTKVSHLYFNHMGIPILKDVVVKKK